MLVRCSFVRLCIVLCFAGGGVGCDVGVGFGSTRSLWYLFLSRLWGMLMVPCPMHTTRQLKPAACSALGCCCIGRLSDMVLKSVPPLVYVVCSHPCRHCW